MIVDFDIVLFNQGCNVISPGAPAPPMPPAKDYEQEIDLRSRKAYKFPSEFLVDISKMFTVRLMQERSCAEAASDLYSSLQNTFQCTLDFMKKNELSSVSK